MRKTREVTHVILTKNSLMSHEHELKAAMLLVIVLYKNPKNLPKQRTLKWNFSMNKEQQETNLI